MWHFVKGLSEVEQDEVNLALYIPTFSKVIHNGDQLGLTGSLLESMLGICKDVVLKEVIKFSTMYDILT